VTKSHRRVAENAEFRGECNQISAISARPQRSPRYAFYFLPTKQESGGLLTVWLRLEPEGVVQLDTETRLGGLKPIQQVFLPVVVEYDKKFVARF
jgi:hypothetical protein